MGISAWQILIVLLIVVLLFGTKKLKNVGGDLGEAIKGFKSGMKEEKEEKENEKADEALKSLEQVTSNKDEVLDSDFIEKTRTSN